MNSANDLISTLKTELNSILLSAGSEITLRQLAADYRAIVNKPIPFREAGYSTLEELVLNIPEAVSPRWINGELRIRAVTNEMNERIAKLVSLTNTKSKRTSFRSVPRNSLSPGTFAKKKYPPQTNMASDNWVNSRQGSLAQTAADFNLLRGEIKTLMFCYRTGLKGSQFADAFAKRYGNYKKLTSAGFPSVLQLLQAMPDVVDIEFIENTDEYIVRGKMGRKTPHGNRLNQLPPRLQDAKSVLNEAGGPLDGTHVLMGKSGAVKEVSETNDGCHGDQLGVADDVDEDDDESEEELKMNIQKVLSLHLYGLDSSKFMAEYERIHGQELQVKNLGYQTAMELIADMPDIAVLERQTNGDWLLFDKRTYEIFERSPYPSTSSLSDFKRSLRYILERNPPGILQKDLEQTYENLTKSSINLSLLGFASLDQLLRSLSDFIDAEYIGEGQVMLKLIDASTNVSKQESANKKNLTLAMFLPEANNNLPEDAVSFGQAYSKQDPPMPDEQYIEVIVSEVNHPSDFWFQRGSMKEALSNLMDSLQKFYSRPSSKNYIVPKEIVRVGLTCVTQYPENGEWHRCEILELKDELAKVFYNDYGTKGFVTQKSLHLITWDFLSCLPSQAIRGRLSRVAPIDKAWTNDAMDCFFYMVVARRLAGLVTHVSRNQECIVSLCLCDTSGNEEIHINDYLILKKHATFNAMEFREEDTAVAVTADPQLTVSSVNAAVAIATHSDDVQSDDLISCSDDVQSDDLITDSDFDVDGVDNIVSDGNGNELELLLQQQLNVNAKPFIPGSVYSSETKEMPLATCRLLKFAQLTPEYGVHLVNIDNKPYVSSTEVSSFFWTEDLIQTTLRNRGLMNLPRLVLTQDEHPNLLKQLYDAKLPGMSKDGKLKEMIVLYELESVAAILELLHHPSERLKLAVRHQLDIFSPNDPYWRGNNELELEERSSDSEQHLQEAWDNLQRAREAYICQMKTASRSQICALVDQLEQIESVLESLKESQSVQNLSLARSKLTVNSVDRIMSQQGLSYLKQIAAMGSSASSKSNGSFTSTGIDSETSPYSSSVAEQNPGNCSRAGAAAVNVPPPSQILLNPVPGDSASAAGQHLLNLNTTNAPPSMISVNGYQVPTLAYLNRMPIPGASNSLPYVSSYPLPYNGNMVSSAPFLMSNRGFNPLFMGPMAYNASALMPAPGFMAPPNLLHTVHSRPLLSTLNTLHLNPDRHTL